MSLLAPPKKGAPLSSAKPTPAKSTWIRPTTPEEIQKQFRADLQELKGLPCWGVVTAPKAGSVFALDFGDKVALTKPIDNPALRAEQRSHRGAYVLYVEAAWRLDGASKIICGCLDSGTPGSLMRDGLAQLVEAPVENTELAFPACDLVLTFKGPLKLRVFCDQTRPGAGDNYHFHTPHAVYVVGARGELRVDAKA